MEAFEGKQFLLFQSKKNSPTLARSPHSKEQELDNLRILQSDMGCACPIPWVWLCQECHGSDIVLRKSVPNVPALIPLGMTTQDSGISTGFIAVAIAQTKYLNIGVCTRYGMWSSTKSRRNQCSSSSVRQGLRGSMHWSGNWNYLQKGREFLGRQWWSLYSKLKLKNSPQSENTERIRDKVAEWGVFPYPLMTTSKSLHGQAAAGCCSARGYTSYQNMHLERSSFLQVFISPCAVPLPHFPLDFHAVQPLPCQAVWVRLSCLAPLLAFISVPAMAATTISPDFEEALRSQDCTVVMVLSALMSDTVPITARWCWPLTAQNHWLTEVGTDLQGHHVQLFSQHCQSHH